MFDDEGKAHAIQQQQQAPAAPEAGPSQPPVEVFKRPAPPTSRHTSPQAGPPSPKRTKFFEYASDDGEVSTASSSSRKQSVIAVNGVNGHVNGEGKGKQKADGGLGKKQRKQRAEALVPVRQALPVYSGSS